MSRRLRFDYSEKWVHWTHAALFIVLVMTAAAMIWLPLARAISFGPYRVVPLVHALCGVAFLVVPFVPWLWRGGAGLAGDLREFVTLAGSKFNVGQRINGLWTIGSMVVLGVTGVVIWLERRVPYWIQEPAYEWHAFVALLAFVVFVGHVVMAALSWLRRAPPR